MMMNSPTESPGEELQAANEALKKANQHLEKNIEEMIVLLIQILEFRVPGARDRAISAKGAARYVSDRMNLGEAEKKKIAIAAFLHEIGKVGLPDGVIAKDGSSLPSSDRFVFQHYPVIGAMLVSTLTGFKEVAHDIYHQLENYDGSGVPDKLIEEELTLGARILRAINLYEESFSAGKSPDECIQRIRMSTNKSLDPRIAGFIVEFLIEKGKRFSCDAVRMSLSDLQPGMALAEDIYTRNGIKLLPKGVCLQEHMLRVLVERNQTDPIPGGVYVCKDIKNNPE
jgi:response regulator RpfG family c-di-GMP phosphodiesterase